MLNYCSSRTFHAAWTQGLLIVFLLTAPASLSLDQAVAGNDGKKLLQLHNRERLKRRIPRLRRRGALTQSAQKYAQAMDHNDHFSHTGPDGSTFADRIKDETNSLNAMGENLAFGQKTSKAVHKAWMRSSGHRRNILSKNFKYVGFGKAGSEPYWVTNFGG